MKDKNINFLMDVAGMEQWFTLKSQIQTQRDDYLRVFLDEAIDMVDAYSNISQGSKLELFPLVSRTDISKKPNAWHSRKSGFNLIENKIVYHTSGTSTGIPLSVAQTMTTLFDLKEGFLYDAFVDLFGSDEINDNNKILFTMLTRKKGRTAKSDISLLFNGALMNFFPFRAETIASNSIFNELLKNNPAIIHATGVTLDEIMELCRYDTSGNSRNLSPMMIFLSGHNLYADEIRRVRDHFNCPILEGYANTEFGVVALRQDNNVFSVRPFFICEVMIDDGTVRNSGTGELIITGLLNDAMPLIRYKTGDRVELFNGGELSAKSTFRLIPRSDEQVIFNNLKLTHFDFDEVLAELPIRRYKVTITSNTEVAIVFEPLFGGKASWLGTTISQRISELVGKGINIQCFQKKVITDNEKYFRLVDLR